MKMPAAHRMTREKNNRRIVAVGIAAMACAFGASGIALNSAWARAQTAESAPAASSMAEKQSGRPLPRGKKLMLKDGSYQLIREYKIEGDRVRYYSLDTADWEEIPADLVDWDKTKSVEADEAKQDASAVAKVKTEEKQRQAEMLDIDASVEIAPKVFLPPGEGMFAFDGQK